VDDGRKAIIFSELMGYNGARPHWLVEAGHESAFRDFDIGKSRLRRPFCDTTKVTPEEKRKILTRRTQETEQRRALCKNKHRRQKKKRPLVQFQNLFHRDMRLKVGTQEHYTSFSLRTSHLRYPLARIACACTSAFHSRQSLLCHLGLFYF